MCLLDVNTPIDTTDYMGDCFDCMSKNDWIKLRDIVNSGKLDCGIKADSDSFLHSILGVGLEFKKLVDLYPTEETRCAKTNICWGIQILVDRCRDLNIQAPKELASKFAEIQVLVYTN
jgi:hypothetical protein